MKTGLFSEQPRLPELIDKIADEEGLTAFGDRMPSPEAMSRLGAALEALTQDGHKVSLLMADLRVCAGVACRCARPMCAQSTIKAIYVGALLEARPQAVDEKGLYMYDAIVYSDNDSYETLRRTYGTAPLRRWCREAGVDEGFADQPYPRTYSARDMWKMWARLYDFLNSGADRSDFGRWLSCTIASATSAQLGDRFFVQTKAGWESGLDEKAPYDPSAPIPPEYCDGDPANDECAINDTGIVYTERGPYIFVIYTDHPFGVFQNAVMHNPLGDLAQALYEVHDSYDIYRCGAD